MKTITRLIISISIFSLLFSWPSLCSSSYLLYSHTMHYFTTNSFHLKSIAMSKNSIFLICNGILVFLATTSPFVCPPSSSGLDDMLHKRVAESLPVVSEVEFETLPEKHMILLDENDDDGDDQETKACDYEEAEEKEAIGEEEIEEDREFEHSNEQRGENDLQISLLFENDDVVGDGDQVEEDDDEIEKLSNEELNKKFEDFIRKMKEEFKTNEYHHQQQLVVVK